MVDIPGVIIVGNVFIADDPVGHCSLRDHFTFIDPVIQADELAFFIQSDPEERRLHFT